MILQREELREEISTFYLQIIIDNYFFYIIIDSISAPALKDLG